MKNQIIAMGVLALAAAALLLFRTGERIRSAPPKPEEETPASQADSGRTREHTDPVSNRRVAIARLKGRESVNTFLAALRDPSPSIRLVAVSKLQSIPEPEVESALIKALGDDSSKIREAAAYALGNNPEWKRATGELIGRRSREKHPRVRKAIVIALGRRADDPAAEELLSVLSDHTQRDLWFRAAGGLRHVDRKHAPGMEQRLAVMEEKSTAEALEISIKSVKGTLTIADLERRSD